MELTAEQVGEQAQFLQENINLKILNYPPGTHRSGITDFCGIDGDRHRSRLQGRHGQRREQTGHPGNRRRDPSPAVYRRRGQIADRYPNRGLHRAGQMSNPSLNWKGLPSFSGTGIGSVPFLSPQRACRVILDQDYLIPFWPQMVRVNRPGGNADSIQPPAALPATGPGKPNGTDRSVLQPVPGAAGFL